MKDRTKHALVILVCATMIVMTGCATTTKTTATETGSRPATTKVIREVREDGTVVLHQTVGDISVPPQASQPVLASGTRKTKPGWFCKAVGVFYAGLAIYANPMLAVDYVASSLD